MSGSSEKSRLGPFDVCLLVPTYACILGLAFFSLMRVHELVHALGHSERKLSWVGLVMDDFTLVPVVIPFAILCYFVLDEVLKRASGRGNPRRASFGSSGPFFVSAGVVVTVMAMLWSAEGGHLHDHISPRVFQIYAWSSAALAAGLLSGIAVGALVRWRSDKLAPLTLLPPIMCIAGLCVVAAKVEGFFGRDGLQILWPRLPRVVIVAIVVLVVSALSGWVERRRWRRLTMSVGLACAGFWVLAAYMALALTRPFHHLCVKEPGAIQIIAACVIAAALCLSAAVRVWVYRLAKRAAVRAETA